MHNNVQDIGTQKSTSKSKKHSWLHLLIYKLRLANQAGRIISESVCKHLSSDAYLKLVYASKSQNPKTILISQQFPSVQ